MILFSLCPRVFYLIFLITAAWSSSYLAEGWGGIKNSILSEINSDNSVYSSHVSEKKILKRGRAIRKMIFLGGCPRIAISFKIEDFLKKLPQAYS
jgi:hypothetical protein